METILAPRDLLQELTALELPPEREARLAQLAARREQGPLAPGDELELQGGLLCEISLHTFGVTPDDCLASKSISGLSPESDGRPKW
jgi:hypothetical protein